MVLAGGLLGLGGAAVAPAATAVTGVCGTYGVYSANNSKCSYNIQSFSKNGARATLGNKAGLGKVSSQGLCSQYTSYGVNYRV